MTELFALYVHWPFCAAKCPYCDFNSHVAASIDHQAWRDAYLREIAHYAALTPGRIVTSIFFGGGTPSLMEPATAAAVIDAIARHWTIMPGAEITLEANPTSVERDKFAAFRAAGVNRVSLGIQALNDADLKFLGRQHDQSEARQAIAIAEKTFDRYTFDLIYARPNQTVQLWRQELEDALKIAGNHLSLYQLTIEEGTPFHLRHARGEFSVPQQDAAGELYEVTQEIMEAAGLPAYEVSNHARPGQESQHNLTYWRYGDYAGIGPGAHGRLTLDGVKQATRGHRAPAIWLERAAKDGHGGHPFEAIDAKKRFTEALMFGLRLKEGIVLKRLQQEAGRPEASLFDAGKLASLMHEGLITVSNGKISATASGRQRLDGILRYLI